MNEPPYMSDKDATGASMDGGFSCRTRHLLLNFTSRMTSRKSVLYCSNLERREIKQTKTIYMHTLGLLSLLVFSVQDGQEETEEASKLYISCKKYILYATHLQ